jgi:hypothetical protein
LDRRRRDQTLRWYLERRETGTQARVLRGGACASRVAHLACAGWMLRSPAQCLRENTNHRADSASRSWHLDGGVGRRPRARARFYWSSGSGPSCAARCCWSTTSGSGSRFSTEGRSPNREAGARRTQPGGQPTTRSLTALPQRPSDSEVKPVRRACSCRSSEAGMRSAGGAASARRARASVPPRRPRVRALGSLDTARVPKASFAWCGGLREIV